MSGMPFLRSTTRCVPSLLPVAVAAFLHRFRLRLVFRSPFENSLAACPDSVTVLRASIRDTGPVVDTRMARRAFQPPYTTKSKGSRLGPPFVQRIVEAHGGAIALVPAAQGGTEVVFQLPRRSE